MKVAAIISLLILISGLFFVSQRKKTLSSAEKNSTSQISTYPIGTDEAPESSEIPLTITKPENRSTVMTPNIVIEGITSPNAQVVINDLEIEADEQGKFSESILIDEGENFITITAIDSEGKYAEKELRITLTSEEPLLTPRTQ